MTLLGTGSWFVALGVLLCADFTAYGLCKPFSKFKLTGIPFCRATTNLCLAKCLLALAWGMFGVFTNTMIPLGCSAICILYAFIELGFLTLELESIAGPPQKPNQNPPRA